MAVFQFENGLPPELEVRGGIAGITDEQYKQGTHSLMWTYQPGDALVFHVPIGYEEITDGHINATRYGCGLYLFDDGSDGSLEMCFLKQGTECVRFKIQLGFAGWRSITAGFDKDMEGRAEVGMDCLVITAEGSGTVLIDELVTANRIDYRYIMASYQLPNFSTKLAPIIKEWNLKKEFILPGCDQADSEVISDRMCQYIVAEFQNGSLTKEDLLERVAQFEISEGPMGLRGKRIEHPPQQNLLSGLPELEENGYIPLRTVADLLRDIALFCTRNPDEELEKAYVLLLRYLMVQGYADGSSMGHHMLMDYGMRPFYNSFLLMKRTIERAGLVKPLLEALRWFLHMGSRGFLEGQPLEHSSADDFNNLSQGTLATILLMEEEKEKAAWLRAYAAWISFNLESTQGLRDMFKEDGCIYHHCGHYLAYGQGALQGLAPVVYALAGTAFDIPKENWNNMKHVLLAMRFQCNTRDYPIAFSARHPTGTWSLATLPYKYFALSALEHGETDMAGVYLRLHPLVEDEFDRILAAAGKPEPEPEGNWSFPYACANVHRRGEWEVVAKGFSKYLWGSESYLPSNRYGRYRSYGVVELVHKTGIQKGGFSHDGYDWNRFPGTTSIITPWEELKTRVYNVDDKSGFEEMLISDQAFAGSTTLEQNGMFSMILTEHPKYNGSFRAYKTVCMKDNFILLMGSGIQDKSEYETETTLFQNCICPDDSPILVNGNPYEGTFVSGEQDVITDNRGHAYYPKSGMKIRLKSGLQHSESSTGSGPTEGNFAVGSILHGCSPQSASYVYGIGLGGAASQAYRIVQQDEKAHAVYLGDALYIAMFEPGTVEGISSDIPVLIMLERRDGVTKMSVCNPDLGLYDQDPSQYDAEGNRMEVSIYSRGWIFNEVGKKTATIQIHNENYAPSTDGICREALQMQLKGGTVYQFELK